MEYFFVFGRLKALSFVELENVCSNFLGNNFELIDKGEYIILKTDVNQNLVDEIFHKLGGFIKYGSILNENLDILSLSENKKVVFGISSYSSKISFKEIKDLSQEFKDHFLEADRKVRFVLPKKGKVLASSQISSNDLIQKGFEIVFLENQLGKTLGVQDIDGFSSRDYEKPFVNKEMGVLPIKLSRMMINLANIKEGETLWDPFCGSGNILLEGLDLGYDVLGSDIDTESLQGTKMNLDWVKKKFKYTENSHAFYLDVLNPTASKLEVVKNINLGGIVCEPYMGEAQRKILKVDSAESLIAQHLYLVKSLFQVVDFLMLKEKIRLVIVFPEYKTEKGWLSVNKDLLQSKKIKILKVSDEDLHWSRVNSIIKRLILVFEYIPK